MATKTQREEEQVHCYPVRDDYQPCSAKGLNDPLGEIKPMRDETPAIFPSAWESFHQ